MNLYHDPSDGCPGCPLFHVVLEDRWGEFDGYECRADAGTWHTGKPAPRDCPLWTWTIVISAFPTSERDE